MIPNKRDLHGYVRVDGSGRLVPSSLILRRTKPKVGRWYEVPAYECCNPEESCITYALLVNRDELVVLTYTDCGDAGLITSEVQGPAEDTFCAKEGTAHVTGSAILLPLGICDPTSSTTTTSTTAAPATTTTTSTTARVTTTTTTTNVIVSDIRLKDNVVATGKTIGGFKEYTWEWNSIAKAIGVDDIPSKGVIAQEVMISYPEAVIIGKDGYYRVNYELLLKN